MANEVEELIKEFNDSNVFKKAFLIVIGVVFGVVCVFLRICAKVLHVTYNTVNVVASRSGASPSLPKRLRA